MRLLVENIATIPPRPAVAQSPACGENGRVEALHQLAVRLDKKWFRATAGLLLLFPIVALVWVDRSAPDPGFHQRLVFPGSRVAYAAFVARWGNELTAAMWHDAVFILLWLLIVPALLVVCRVVLAPVHRRETPANRPRSSFDLWAAMPFVACAAGAFDICEDVCVLVARHHPWCVPVMTTFALLKFLAYGVSMIGVFGLVVGPWAAPALRPLLRWTFSWFDKLAHHHPDVHPTTSLPEDGHETIGIAVSGGGIRSASVALGALGVIDRPSTNGSPSVFARARWLSAVSGGAYTAGGWRVARRPGDPVAPSPTPTSDGLFETTGDWFRSIQSRRRYLDNGVLSLFGGIVNVVVRTAIAAGTVLAVAAIGGWFTGRLVHSRVVQPCFPQRCVGHPTAPTSKMTTPSALKFGDLFRQSTVVPWALLLSFGAVVCVVALCLRGDARTAGMNAALACAGIAVGLFLILVGVPASILYVHKVLGFVAPAGYNATDSATGFGAVIVAAVATSLRRALVSEAKKRWLRLGGALMALGVFLWAGKVADAVARHGTTGHSRLQSGWTPVLALIVVVFYECIPAHRLTLGGVYRKRLAATFTLANGTTIPLPALAYDQEPMWASYVGADGPELVIAATAHATGNQIGGVAGLGFTFSAEQFVLYDAQAWVSPAAAFPSGSWWEGYPRGWIVSRTVALSGAAFASAMGRQGLGTTNALLAGLGLRLGSWIPNPRWSVAFNDDSRRPRVHLGYFAKEIFGIYRPTTDPFLYVADGGHRENLGLVELLRQHPRPRVVLVIDASGDTPGTFTTLHEAIELASVELGIHIEIDWQRIEHPARGLPGDCATSGVVTFEDGTRALLLFAHYQVCELSPAALKQFAAQHKNFPNYSTGDQFLTQEEFDHLVALGEHMGERMLALASEVEPG